MKRMTGFILPIILLAGSQLFTGCIGKYKTQIASQQDEIATLEEENQELKTNNDRLSAEGDEQRAALSALEQVIVELEGRVASMAEYNAALEKELEKLGGDKAVMTEKYEKAQKIISEMKVKERQAKARLRTIKNMLAKFKKLIKDKKLNVKIRDGKMMLVLPSAVLFDLGSASVSKEGKKTLKEVARVLSGIGGREFQVAGHTDPVPIKSGNYETNWELSVARSVAVVRFMQKHGVKPRSLSASGYSQYRPAVKNDSPENRTLNRRIEIVLMPNLSELPDLSDLEKELNK